jgi:hypothetical protein|tara:strand:- start:535 stop:912 length:378 start_codon:yes stop_codon:yes gene_type:complete
MEFKIDQNKPDANQNTVEIFTIKGKQSFLDDAGYPRLDESQEDDYNAFAKKMLIGKRTKYYVKRGRHGKLFNPMGMYSEGTAKKQLRHAGRPEWEYKETTKEVFSKYIKFLKTRNIAWLNNAERE